LSKPKKLRVLTISKPYVGRAYRDKIGIWARHPGLEIGLLCPYSWGTQEFERDPEGSDPGYSLINLPIRFNGRNHFHYYRGLEAEIAKFAPDILNIEEEHYSFVTWQACRIAVKHQIPAIFYTWQNIYKRYPMPFSQIEQYVFRHSAAAATGNQEAVDILRRKGFQGKVRVIPQMGVTPERFQPLLAGAAGRSAAKESLGLAVSKFWLVFAGRIVEEKGLDELIDALILGTSPNVAAVILGDGPHLSALRQRAEILVKQGRLLFRSQVPSTDVAIYLRAADVMCLPSRTKKNWKEQFGRIIVEAMASEAVVLGSSSGEIPNVIGDAGMVFREGDVMDLRTKINHLVDHPEACEGYRRAGTRRVVEHYSNEVIAAKFYQLFVEVAGG
jgi:glycosyltransferase involved in cell wall biosynthesis